MSRALIAEPKPRQEGKKGACYKESMTRIHQLQSISDDDLLRRLTELVQQSRRVEADLIAHIGEVDDRRLFAREACSSMFVYAIEVLHLRSQRHTFASQ